jgi:hypothetical protein
MSESELHKARVEYTGHLAHLILWIFAQGYEVMIGQEGLKHMEGSLHYQGLADDLLIFKDEVYLKNTEDYRFAGEYWKSLSPLCAWGGDFQKADGNHFSRSFGGKK